MTSDEIHNALMSMYPAGAYAYIREFRAGTGYSADSNRYFDAWVIGCYPSTGLVRIAIEIKISRSDFKRELSKPIKRDAGLRLSNEFYFAAPKGLISVAELPGECGLIEIDPLTAKASITEPAQFRETLPATWVFVASLARRVKRGSKDFE